MEHRPDLQTYLCELAQTNHVYFDPPQDLIMSYPAVVYTRSEVDVDYADNKPYRVSVGYMVTVIDEDPDSEIVSRFMHVPRCRWNRHYVADGLHHDVFKLYY